MTNKATPILTICTLMCIAVLCNVQFFSNGQHVDTYSQIIWEHDSTDMSEHFDSVGESAVLPGRSLSSEFLHSLQLTPVFELIFAFFVSDTVIAHLTYLRTIPDVEPWYQNTNGGSIKSRLAGWKQSRDPHANSFSIV